jgi:FixJ family two-component response regulator
LTFQWKTPVHVKREVVLIEDDGGMRQAIERILKGAGYHVRSFASAEALLESLAGSGLWDSSHCLVCDVRLPGATGFELHRRLVEQGPLPPCIFITAYDDPAIRGQAERTSSAYLPKPFEGRTLLAVIARSLQATSP